ncbi:MAG: extracellular solute-binding protein [Oscillospiraceae bacterium]|nr:extracellular solute-binding protein [Oscillospiraceae bacterium]
MKKTWLGIISAILVLSLVACAGGQNSGTEQNAGTNAAQGSGQQSAAPSGTSSGVVKVPIMMRNAGNDSQAVINEFMVENYNKLYEGQYELEVEWLPGVAEDYRTKLKMLNASNDLPAWLYDLHAETAFAELLIQNNRLVDLKPHFDASPEWQRMAIPESVEFNTTADGKMYTSPAVSTEYVGIFYNKEHFQNAGIASFPETWDDFWDACNKLKAAGYTPLSLHTTETGWCPMLLGTSTMALSDEGQAFMNQMFPTDFNVPVVINMLDVITRLFTYSTADAVGGNYALAANNFCSGNTSMIPNGPWMVASLSDPQFAPEGFEEKVGYAMYPGKTMLSNQGKIYEMAVSVDHPEEVQLGAIELVKYRASEEFIRFNAVHAGYFSTVVPLTDEDMESLSPVMREYAARVLEIERTLLRYQAQWDPLTQNEVISTELVSLINGTITSEEMATKMSESAAKFATDSQG